MLNGTIKNTQNRFSVLNQILSKVFNKTDQIDKSSSK